MNIISPLTLLIVPLIGSLIIIAYPYLTYPFTLADRMVTSGAVKNSSLPAALAQAVPKPNVTNLPLGGRTHLAYAEQPTGIMQVDDLPPTSVAAIGVSDELKQMPLIDKKNSQLKKIAILTSLVNFIISIILWIQFDSSYVGYQFVTDSYSLFKGSGLCQAPIRDAALGLTGSSWDELGSLAGQGSLAFARHQASPPLQYKLGVDGISLFFILLTTFITPVALLSSHNDIEKNLKFYLVSILLLETLQIAVFVVLDLLLFYIFFESVLIPLFFIVGV